MWGLMIIFISAWILGFIAGLGIRPMYYLITGKDIPLLKEDKSQDKTPSTVPLQAPESPVDEV